MCQISCGSIFAALPFSFSEKAKSEIAHHNTKGFFFLIAIHTTDIRWGGRATATAIAEIIRGLRPPHCPLTISKEIT